MVYVFERAGDMLTCQTRSALHGPGYELVVTDGRRSLIEHFLDVRSLEHRQGELRHHWLMHGWRAADPAADVDELGG